MRDRNLLYLFLGLNVALAGAFVAYLVVSNNSQPKVVATAFPDLSRSNKTHAAAVTNIIKPVLTKTNAVVVVASSNSLPAQVQVQEPATNSAPLQPVFTQKKFGWKEVESPEYVTYLKSLRAIGCPEDKVRNIVLADVGELFQQKKLKLSVESDQQWWKPHSEYFALNGVNMMAQRGQALEEERRTLLEKLLGAEVVEKERVETLQWSSVQLTGPVLGKLAPQLHNQIQEIGAESIQRQQAYQWERFNSGQPLNNAEMEGLREQTRADLRKVLNAAELEEFLLRYSYDASQLREELRPLDPTSEEFRKVFRATDPLDHQMLQDFGGVEGMSETQRNRYEKDRLEAVRQALGPERFQAYMLTKDPIYRQAQMTALQYGSPKSILPIYEMAKVSETKRQKILRDVNLTPQQKTEALNALNLEHQRSVQQIVNGAAQR